MLAMLAAALGWLMPVPAAILQELIDVAVILTRCGRSSRPARSGQSMTAAAGQLHHDHLALLRNLDRLRSIIDALDDAVPEARRRADWGSAAACSEQRGDA